jgi:type II secretory pathway pseudopilin PulG
MRSESGSSLVAVLAALLVAGVLAAALLPGVGHSSAPSAAAPTPQSAVRSARTAVQALDAQQARAAASSPGP